MDRELKRKGIISIAVHALLIIFLIIRSFISCHRADIRNISPFIDVQMGSGTPGGGGGAIKQTATKQDDAFPEQARRTKGQVDVSKKLVKRSVKTTKKKLSKNEIKKMLAKGITGSGSTLPGTGSRTGSGGSGIYHPYARYYNQVRAAMYEAWQQPSSLTGKKGFITTVEIRVQRNGNITAKKITTPSGNTQMDDSVTRALEAVTHLPELPAGMGGFYKNIIIDFELTDMALPDGL